MERIIEIFKSYGITPQHLSHYKTAFTHSSYTNERKSEHLDHNERLEFLGDAVLEMHISEYLYRHFPLLDEGQLSRFRARIVCEKSLAERCVACGFDRFILLGKGEEKAGGRRRPGMLCDLFEAVVGALYLDLGSDMVVRFLEQTIYPKIQEGAYSQAADKKTQLQELLQAKGSIQLSYRTIHVDGPPHDRSFEMGVYLEDQLIGKGEGKTKKVAEQAAAADALRRIKNN